MQYGRLLDISRELIEPRVSGARGSGDCNAGRFEKLFPTRRASPRCCASASCCAPGCRRRSSAPCRRAGKRAWPATRRARTMLVFEGCVQPALAPNINLPPAARLLDRLGISVAAVARRRLLQRRQCHTSGMRDGLDFARRNIDAWWSPIEAGVEAIVVTASGCGCVSKRTATCSSTIPPMPKRRGGLRANPGYQRDSVQGKSVGAETARASASSPSTRPALRHGRNSLAWWKKYYGMPDLR